MSGLAGLFFGVWGLAYWLKVGQWSGRTLAYIFGPYQAADWSGVTQIMLWLWAQPLWAVFVVAGIAMCVVGLLLVSD